MSTTIEWTHVPGYRGDVWNPTTGCNKVSQGCKHCYAETMHRRLHAMGVKGYDRPFLEGARPMPERLHKPLKTKTPTAYFVNSMSDPFHADVPFSYLDQVFAVMALCQQHIFIVLTKRPERMAKYTTTHFGHLADRIIAMRRERGDNGVVIPLPNGRPGSPWWPLPNVWLGTSVEDQATADARIPHLLMCPAAVRFLSCEPLLGPVNLDTGLRISWQCSGCKGYFSGGYQKQCPGCEKKEYWSGSHQFNSAGGQTGSGIHWVIAGGESGPKARPMHPDWARGLRDQCQAAGVPFFFKQWGEWVGGQFDKRKAKMICQEGTVLSNGGRIYWTNPGQPKLHLWDEADHYWTNASAKVGKARAGRLLDGREHTEWPKVITPEPVEA